MTLRLSLKSLKNTILHKTLLNGFLSHLNHHIHILNHVYQS
nr:MAG TPA: hypothetical protein [Caudoviricetes sp.]